MYDFGQGDPGYGQFGVSGYRDQSRVVQGQQQFAPVNTTRFPMALLSLLPSRCPIELLSVSDRGVTATPSAPRA